MAVLLYHAAATSRVGPTGALAVPGGFLGVSTFFTLSGFLITGLLLHDTGPARDRLGRFWRRRVRRLVPAAIGGIALALAFGWWAATPAQADALPGDTLGALLTILNWRFIAQGVGYLEGDPSPLAHFWSLAIEAQFYVVFPLVAVFALTRRRLPHLALAGVSIAAAAGAVTFARYAGTNRPRAYLGTDTRAAELLVGVLLALVVFHPRVGRLLRRPKVSRAVGVLGTAALVAALALWLTADLTDGRIYNGALGVYALVSALVIGAAIVSGNPVSWTLSRPPLRALGAISYGVYVYHWPVFLVVRQQTAFSYWPALVVKIGITLALAIASYHLIHMPVREGRKLVRVQSRHLVPVVVAAIAVAALTLPGGTDPRQLVTTDAVDPELAAAVRGEVEIPKPPPRSTAGSTTVPSPPPGPVVEGATTSPPVSATVPLTEPPTLDRPLRVLVVGDSAAFFTGLGMRTWGVETGMLSVAQATEIGCGLARGGLRWDHRPDLVLVPPHCPTWPTDFPVLVDRHRPDVVVMQDGLWEAMDRRLHGDDTTRAVGDARYDDFLVGEWIKAAQMLTAAGALLAWLDNPPIEWGRGNAGDALIPPLPCPCDGGARMGRLNELLPRVVEAVPAGRIVPYTAHLESYPGGVLDAEVRPDGLHTTAQSAVAVSNWLGPYLIDLWLQRSEATRAKG